MAASSTVETPEAGRPGRRRLGDILVQSGVLDEARLRIALREQAHWGGRLGRILVESRLVREADVVQALSVQLNVPAVTDLAKRPIAADVLKLLPLEFCVQHSLMPFQREGRMLDVAVCDPTNLAALDQIHVRTRLSVRPHIVGTRQLEQALQRHYRSQGGEPPEPEIEILREPARAAAARTPVQGVPIVPTARACREEADDPSGDFEEGARSSKPRRARSASAGRTPAAPAPVSTPDAPAAGPAAPAGSDRLGEIEKRVQVLESLLARDEDVIRKMLGLLVDSGLVDRQQLAAYLSRG